MLGTAMGIIISSTGVRVYLVGSTAAKISSASSSREATGAVRFVRRDRDREGPDGYPEVPVSSVFLLGKRP